MENIGVMVPAEHIAKVIGKGGAGLKQIRETTSCKLQVQPNDATNSGPRRIDLSGAPHQIAAGFQIIVTKAFAEPDAIPILWVPADNAGQIVGKGGENLRRVRETCHVRVQLDRENIVNQATNVQERQLTMQGEPMQLGLALRCVLGAGAPTGPANPSNMGMGMGMSMGMGAFVGVPAPGSFCSQVRAASADPQEVQIHFKVPDRLAGAIIGKGGEQLKQTASEAGCRVSMTPRDSAAGRHAVLQGTFPQCQLAQQMLNDQINAAASEAAVEVGEVTAVYLVRKIAAGAVIGKGGESLKQIRESSGARIQLAREEAEGQRPCQISGNFQQVVQAEQMIHDVALATMANDPAAASGPGASAPALPGAAPQGMSL